MSVDRNRKLRRKNNRKSESETRGSSESGGSGKRMGRTVMVGPVNMMRGDDGVTGNGVFADQNM